MVSLGGVEVKDMAGGEHREGKSGHSGVLETHREVKVIWGRQNFHE